jgi:predicted DCC family thiol-disulfide oxidoreductase YuxK
MQTQSASKYILAYDVDCRPCTKFRNLVDSLDRHNKITFVSLTDADSKGLLGKVAVDARYKSFHLLLPDGQVKSGSEGVLELIRILPGGTVVYPIVIYLPGAKHLVRFIYKMSSRLRDNGSCTLKS